MLVDKAGGQFVSHAPGLCRKGNAAGAVRQAQKNVFPAAPKKRTFLDQQRRRLEYRFGIAGAKGLQQFKFFEKVVVTCQIEAQLAFQRDAGKQRVGAQHFFRHSVKPGAKFFQSFRRKAHARRLTVPAKVQQAVCRAGQPSM